MTFTSLKSFGKHQPGSFQGRWCHHVCLCWKQRASSAVGCGGVQWPRQSWGQDQPSAQRPTPRWPHHLWYRWMCVSSPSTVCQPHAAKHTRFKKENVCLLSTFFRFAKCDTQRRRRGSCLLFHSGLLQSLQLCMRGGVTSLCSCFLVFATIIESNANCRKMKFNDSKRINTTLSCILSCINLIFLLCSLHIYCLLCFTKSQRPATALAEVFIFAMPFDTNFPKYNSNVLLSV